MTVLFAKSVLRLGEAKAAGPVVQGELHTSAHEGGASQPEEAYRSLNLSVHEEAARHIIEVVAQRRRLGERDPGRMQSKSGRLVLEHHGAALVPLGPKVPRHLIRESKKNRFCLLARFDIAR